MIYLVSIGNSIQPKHRAYSNYERDDMDHFCIPIEPFDGKVLLDHLQDHGIKTGPVENRYGEEGLDPSIYLHDPEGNRIELKGPTAGT